jgi:hypothetical protein
MMRVPAIAAVGVTLLFGATASMMGGWFLLVPRADGSLVCDAGGPLATDGVPPDLAPIFRAAASRYSLGGDGPAVLAGLTKVESDFGRDRSTSSAGAVGWTQFMPDTWREFGVDGDGVGRRDPQNAADAIFSAANYLRYLGAPTDWRRALFGYNHAGWYVDRVLTAARQLAGGRLVGGLTSDGCSASTAPALGGGVGRVFGGGRIVPIPGEPGMTIDERLLPDLMALRATYRFRVTAGFAATGHEPGGEHPLGLAVDLVPGQGGSWDDIDALARFAEPQQNHPRPPFRWVGYDGDPGHGRGNHLHLSWMHAPAPERRPPARWVEVFSVVSP